LKIQVFDANEYTSDKIIGETSIDLEDRWFHPKWTEIPIKTKPLEFRSLFTKGTATTQGLAMLWLDILNVPEVKKKYLYIFIYLKFINSKLKIYMYFHPGSKVFSYRYLWTS
jgi:hypothetical protein